jgi:leucyl aminopeptidase
VFKSIKLGSSRSPLHVVGVLADAAKAPKPDVRLDKLSGGHLSDAVADLAFRAEPGETAPAGSDHLLLGLGKPSELGTDTIRTVGARLLKALDRRGVTAIELHLGGGLNVVRRLKPDAAGRALAEGLGLANWRVDFFDGKATKKKPAHGTLTVRIGDARLAAGFEAGLRLSAATNYARRIAATPPNICNPGWMADEARRLAKQAGLRCTVIDFKDAKRRGMGGLEAVGQGSAAKPCIIILEHKPARIAAAARGQRIALVGKTVTYDTGGYSLKVNNGMKGMKYDKCGGMAVLGAMSAIAQQNLPAHVYGVLTCAENMVGDNSYRPDDIITMYNGVTVEVTNTDAEGRLVLGDALAYACRDLKATQVVDVATLTGGIVTALGRGPAGADQPGRRVLGRAGLAHAAVEGAPRVHALTACRPAQLQPLARRPPGAGRRVPLLLRS